MPRLTPENILYVQCKLTDYTECYIAAWIWKIIPLILVVFGIIGNVLTLTVLSSKKFRKKSTCVYLMFLAVTDTTALCSKPLIHFLRSVFGFNILSTSIGCSIDGWIGFSSGLISCWIIVLITAERALLCLFPVKAKPKMTPRNALFISVVVSLIVTLLNSHLIYGNIIVERHINVTVTNETSIQFVRSCSLRPGDYLEFHNMVWNKLLLVFGSLIPIILIVTGNAVVAMSLIKHQRALRRVQQSDGIDASNMTQSSRNKANYRLFFVLCGVYILTTVPYGIYISTFPFNKEVDDHTLAKYQLTAVIMRCLLWSNFSFNFLLYFLTGSLFRKGLWSLFEPGYKFIISFLTRGNVQPQSDQNI